MVFTLRSLALKRGKPCNEAILVVDHDPRPLTEPLLDLGLVGLAEDFVLRVQVRNSQDDSVAVRLVLLLIPRFLLRHTARALSIPSNTVLEGALGQIL